MQNPVVDHRYENVGVGWLWLVYCHDNGKVQ